MSDKKSNPTAPSNTQLSGPSMFYFDIGFSRGSFHLTSLPTSHAPASPPLWDTPHLLLQTLSPKLDVLVPLYRELQQQLVRGNSNLPQCLCIVWLLIDVR